MAIGVYKHKIKHGEAKNSTKEYRAWNHIKSRCNPDPESENYKNYYGRGIRVCDRWLESYENFLSDVGRAPDRALTIDRINNDGNYEPGNVRWATRKEQQNNKRGTNRVEYKGEIKNLRDWAKHFGLSYTAFYHHFDRGKTFEEIISRTKGTQLAAKSNSGYKGVHLNKRTGKYQVFISKIGGGRIYGGCYETDIEAALRFNELSKQYFGELAILNKIPSSE